MRNYETRILKAVAELSGIPEDGIIKPPGCIKCCNAKVSRARQLCVRLVVMVHKERTTYAGRFLGLGKSSSRNTALRAQGRESVDAKFRQDLVALYHTLNTKKEYATKL
jgi:hypothetical protein